MFFRKKSTTPRRRPGGRDADETPAKRPSVFSYRASRSNAPDNLGRGKKAEQPVRRHRLTLRQRARKVLKICLVLLVIVFIGRNLMLSGTPDLVLTDPANTLRDSSVYQEAAAKAFAASKLNSNKVTVNTAAIEELLKRAFPELAGVSVSLPMIGQKAVVYLQPSTARLIVHSAQGPFVVDDSGKAVADGPMVDTLRQAGLPEVHDESQHVVQLGQSVLPSTTVAFITEVVYQLKAKGLVVDSLRLPNTPSELHLRLKDTGYYTKFYTKGDARVEAGAFLALKQHLEAQGKTPAEYIDVRVENRAFYN